MRTNIGLIPLSLCLLAGHERAQADQQKIFKPSAMPIVDMHTHMDFKPQYDKAV